MAIIVAPLEDKREAAETAATLRGEAIDQAIADFAGVSAGMIQSVGEVSASLRAS